MVRFDKKQPIKKEIKQLTAADIFEGRTLEDINKVEEVEENVIRKHVQIDNEHQSIIEKLFIDDILKATINDKQVIDSVNNNQIIINEDLDISEVIEYLKEKKDLTFLDFIKNYYIYNLDSYTDKAYEEPVTAIQELPYSFEVSSENSKKVIYEFLK
jgi:DNA-directed RNA polymerase beta' subunit